MKKEMALGLLSLFLFFQLASAQLVLNPTNFHVEVVGGETVSKNFTIEWKGEAPTVGYISYEIEEENGSFEGSEMWLTFSENPVILEPNSPKEITAYIHTAPNISPGNYTIQIKAITYLQYIKEVEVVEKEKPIILIKNVTVEKIKEVPKEVPVYFENTTRIQEMNSTIFSLNQTISNLLSKIDEMKTSHINEIGWYQLAILVLISVLALYIIHQKVVEKRCSGNN